MVKKYIMSIDEEAKQSFDKSINLINERVKKEVLGASLLSSMNPISQIIDKELKDFNHTLISLIDFYVEGIYNSGKLVSRKKLRLKKQTPQNGERYYFTLNDKDFIDKYKSLKLESLNEDLNGSVIKYVEHIIKNKIYGKWVLDDDDDYKHFEYQKQEFVENDMGDILKVIDESIEGIYEEVIELVTRELLTLFKRAQVEEYKNLGIHTVTFIAEDETACCPICNVLSGKIFNVSSITDGIVMKDGIRHALCKYSIDPVINYQTEVTEIIATSDFGPRGEVGNNIDNNNLFLNNEIEPTVNLELANMKFINMPIELEYRISRLIKKFQISAKELLQTNYEFIFVSTITDQDDWFKTIKQHYIEDGKNDFDAENKTLHAQDTLQSKISSFDLGEKFYISNSAFDSQLVEDIIIRKLISNFVKTTDWIEKKYDEKRNSKHLGNGVVMYESPFINYLAEESSDSYLRESIIAYINHSNKLRAIDEETYNYIKDNVFNSKQFF